MAQHWVSLDVDRTKVCTSSGHLPTADRIWPLSSAPVITEIDGVDIHFIHMPSQHEDALPLIVTHGWPGSTIEQPKIIDPLTDPTAHGATTSTVTPTYARDWQKGAIE